MNPNIYNLAFSNSHDLAIIADCNHQIIDVNPTAIENFGFSKEAFLNMNLSQLFHDEQEGIEFLKNICIKNHVIHWEFDFKNKEGDPFPVLLNADLIDEEEGIFLVVAQNIRKMQKEIRDRRTKSEMMLLGKLSHTLSHEIRNPLNNIFLGMNQFSALLSNDEREDVAFFLDYLEKNSQRIKEIIDNLLGPRTLFKMNKAEMNLNELVNLAVHDNSEKIKNSNIILNLELSEQPLLFELDKDMMRMALNNLIKNAIESVTNNEGVVYIKTAQKDARISMMISDNGHGIPKEDQKKIFEPFFTTKINGIGLGLINTEQILTAHGIALDVQSEVGRGSTFTLNFDRFE